MKKQVKNLFALFLTASMAVSLVPADAFAAVHDAVKDATTTTAYEKVEAEKKAAQPKAGSAEAAIQEALYTNTDEVDLSKYNLTERKAEKLTDKSLGENKDTNLVDVTYETDANGKVTTMSVEKDDTYAYALEEIDELAADDAGEDDGSGKTKTEVGQAYKDLMAFYESPDNQEYLGIATPYFTSKDSKGGPVSSLLSLMQQKIYKEGDPEEENPANAKVTYKDMYDVIQGYQTTLQYGIQLFGQQLLAARDEALAQIDDSMTREQKLLVLNDWLGKYCTFDMGAIQEEQDKKNDTETTEEAIQAMGETAAVALADDGQQQPTEEQIAYLRNMLLNGDLKTAFESTAFGALVRRNTICAGYTSAYTYLVQCAFPEIYKEADGKTWKKASEVNGTDSSQDKKDDNSSSENKGDTSETDKEENSSAAETETQAADGEDSSGDASSEKKDETTTETKPTYIVDFVKIFWRSNVQMLGQSQTFRNSHYFNAVKTDDSVDNWYYVDSCYNDIYVECMGRNRVETDGNMTHSYFLISHTSLAKQFDGNFDYIDTLYENVATDTTYEDSWVNNAQGPVSYDDTYYYYIKNTSSYSQSGGYKKGEEQIVRVPRKSGLTSSDGEEVLLNLSTGDTKSDNTEAAELVKKEFAVDNDVNSKKYAGITHSVGYYNSALYFNVNNKIFKYDLGSDKITEVKEYNTVSAQQDEDNEFTGMSFTVTTDKDKTVHTVKNHPIAALAIKDDGKMYVSIATNYCYASDYKYEETNYNSEYMNYKMGNQTISRGGDNDNQEFMWSANFVDTLDMSKVSSTDESAHHFDKVTVDPTCDANGFTEERCTDADCGIVKADTKEDTDQKATGHHYIKANDLYYTKDDAGNRKSGTYYLCTKCLDAQSSLPDGETAEHAYGNATATWNDDNTEAEVTVSCTECEGKELDALLDDQNKDTQELTKTAKTTDIKVEKPEGFDCEKGGEVTYVATATIDGKEYKASKKVTVEAGKHTYGEPTFKWSDDNKTCKATFKCTVCGTEHTEDCTVTSKIVAATCTTKGSTTYTATVSMNGKDYTDTKETDVVDPLGHKYGEPTFKWSDDHKTCTATFTCENDNSHVETVDCTITPETTKAVTCEEDGEIVYTASCEFGGKTYTNPETYKEVVKSSGHQYKDPVYTWSTDDEGNKVCVAAFTCSICGKTENVPGTVKAETTKEVTCTEDGSIKYTATISFNDQTYTTSKIETVQKTGHKYDDNGVCTVCGHKKPVITLKAKKAVYTGKAISIDEPTITEGEVVNLNYSYYSDKDCKNEISEPVDPGVYYVTVTADAGSDNAGVTSNTVTLTIAPQATKVTSVANATSNVTVSWNKVSKASGYYVYRSTDGKKFTKIATVKSASTVKYNDKKATKNGQKYVYKVVTYYNGNQTVSSAYSAAKTGYRLSTMKVSSLTNKKGKKAYIKWTKNSKSTGYQIKYVTGKSKAKTVKASSKAKTKTISKLKKGKTYKVRIRSYKKVSNVTYYSAWSKQKSVKIKK